MMQFNQPRKNVVDETISLFLSLHRDVLKVLVFLQSQVK